MSRPTDFWKDFAQALRKQGEKRPVGAGWKTLDELVPIIGGHRTNVGHMLMGGVKAGIIERFVGLTLRDGKLKGATWYREKKK